ncbi:MAG: acylneuraminate cytidylyltransferase family protein [Betaproteobacteria bacterium]|nr:MAG: acylneuraminate cytidylyltransferase family protein [Betaproteobacteria bacterium]
MSISTDNTVALVLARAGSKRVPQKNVRLLNGKPLIAYTFEAAIASNCFGSIVVSTDDERVMEIAAASGIAIDERPEALRGDTVRAVEVVEEYLLRTDASGQYSDVAMLLPTCPFRSVDDLRGAMAVYRSSGQRIPLITVTAYEFPPQLALEPADGTAMRMCDANAYALTTRSQSIPTRFHPNGGLYVAPLELFLEQHSFFTPHMLTYQMPAERSFDIDYPWQLELAEHWARNLAKGTK